MERKPQRNRTDTHITQHVRGLTIAVGEPATIAVKLHTVDGRLTITVEGAHSDPSPLKTESVLTTDKTRD